MLLIPEHFRSRKQILEVWDKPLIRKSSFKTNKDQNDEYTKKKKHRHRVRGIHILFDKNIVSNRSIPHARFNLTKQEENQSGNEGELTSVDQNSQGKMINLGYKNEKLDPRPKRKLKAKEIISVESMSWFK